MARRAASPVAKVSRVTPARRRPGTLAAPAVEPRILLIRGQRVLLDADLARMYGVPTKVLNQAVTRNIERFPEDFLFRLTLDEAASLRSQTVTLNASGQPIQSRGRLANLKSQTVTSSSAGWGGRRKLPLAFTEQGVAMLSSVLRSPRAVAVNVEIMRAFVRLRQLLASNDDLRRKLDTLESKYDDQFRIVFDAIRALMEPPEEDEPKRPRIGFKAD